MKRSGSHHKQRRGVNIQFPIWMTLGVLVCSLEPAQAAKGQAAFLTSQSENLWTLPSQTDVVLPPLETKTILAQTSDNPLAPILREDGRPPSTEPLSEPELPPSLPDPEQLLPASPTTPISPPGSAPDDIPNTIIVEQFEILGSTVFTEADFAEATAPFVNRPITFQELFQVRDAITQLYVSRGYLTSGAFIPPQTLEAGVVQIQVVEGSVEEINVTGTRRLNPGYVSSRLGLAARPPVNVEALLEGLQVLQLDPLIETVSAELAAGVRPGTSILDVTVQEANPLQATIAVDNARSPSVGTTRVRADLSYGNVLGLGDRLSIGYALTEGSQAGDLSYAVPVSPRNAEVIFSAGFTESEVIEEPFDVLDIESDSNYYELTFRQPLIQTPTEDFVLSLSGSWRESSTEFLGDFGPSIPFPSIGADDEGRTRISALRFTQEWTRRSTQQVLAVRSQFSLGVDALNSTVNSGDIPDSEFFAWRGQAQWVRLLAPETLFLLQGDLQLAADSLLPQEQFGLGGQSTVRGYRQDQLLTDNGFLVSAEVRLPVLRWPEQNSLFHLIPFIDYGIGWNTGSIRETPDSNSLLSVGAGLQWQIEDTFSARLDWGIPLTDVDGDRDTLQESGLHFSIVVTP